MVTRWIAPLAAALAVCLGAGLSAQDTRRDVPLASQLDEVRRAQQDLEYRLDQLAKSIDDVLWFQRLGDLATVDKWRIVGPPDANPESPTAPGALNPVKFYAYTFVPRERKAGASVPMVVLLHGGVHGDLSTYYVHIVRELVAQGYLVVAPEYRGSTGYGKTFHQLIDYGGREVDDAHAATIWALETFDFVDPKRVGLVGWSHGGMIALLAAFQHPHSYACAFAGVPVSDLVMRMGYSDKEYEDEFAAPFHIGKTVREDIDEYKRRSPVWHVDKLAIPLRIHTTTNDEDVNVVEVEHLIQALKAAGKEFESKVYTDAPGGHGFDRTDTTSGRAARREAWEFLARYLRPPRPAADRPL